MNGARANLIARAAARLQADYSARRQRVAAEAAALDYQAPEHLRPSLAADLCLRDAPALERDVIRLALPASIDTWTGPRGPAPQPTPPAEQLALALDASK